MKTKELALAESIVALADTMNINHPGVLPKFTTLLSQYDELVHLINDPATMPSVGEFNQEKDFYFFMGAKKVSNHGKEKFYLIATKCKQYIAQNSSEEQYTKIVSATSEKGWNKGYVITIVGIIIAAVIGLSYNQGANSKEKELYDERDSLKQANIVFQKKITTLNDSITNLNNYLDTLQNIASLKERLNDSLNTLSIKTRAFEDSLKKTNQKIDSLKHENRRISNTYDGMWSLFQQAEKSLKKCQKQCVKN